MKGTTVASARVVLGHVAPTPWESAAAAKALVGKSISAGNRRSRRQGRRCGRQAAQPERLQGEPGEGGGKARAAGGRKGKGIAMERPGLTKISMNRCEKLRWKGLFIEAEWDPTIQHSNDRAFWCQHTFKPIGPDGQVVRRLRVQSGAQLLRAVVRQIQSRDGEGAKDALSCRGFGVFGGWGLTAEARGRGERRERLSTAETPRRRVKGVFPDERERRKSGCGERGEMLAV